MVNSFERVSRISDPDSLPLPKRGTLDSAGYDFVVSEDTLIPPYDFHKAKIYDKVMEINPKADYYGFVKPLSLDDIAKITKETNAKPTLVPTGIKVYLDPGYYLELSVRSSTPLKHWLILANGVGIIDRDYVDNPDNEGEIFFQIINLLPFAIQLKKGDRIGQGIIKAYNVTSDDAAEGERKGGFGSTNE